MATQIYGKIHFDDINGVPLSGGKVYVYEPGTTTDKASYTTPAASVANTQPVILDSRGEAGIYVIGDCKIVVNDSLGNLIYTLDNVKDLSAELAASSGSSLVGFIQSGTGAVARTVQSKERETVSVFDFMTSAEIADVQAGTLTIDVTASLNSAFAMVGRRVFMPKGNYKITSNLNEPLCASIVGEGYQFTLITAAAGVTNVFKFGTAAVNFNELRSLSIYGNATASAIGIILGNNQLVNLQTFTDVQIFNFTGTGAIGIDVRDAVTHTFNHCYINRNYLNVRTQIGVVSGCPTTVTFNQCDFREATTIGVKIITGYGITFNGCIFEANANEGCYVGAGAGAEVCIGIKFCDCWFEGNWGADTTKYQLVVTNAPTGQTDCALYGGYFNSSGATAKAIKWTGTYTFGYWEQVYISNIAAMVLIESDATVYAGMLPSNVSYSTIVNDTTGKSVRSIDTMFFNQETAWTSWTPTYSSNIGNAAATFTATPTTTRAKYKIIGKILYVSILWSSTILPATTPAWIGISLPSGISADTTNQYATASVTSDTVDEIGVLRSGDYIGAWAGTLLQYRNASSLYIANKAVGGQFNVIFELH